MAAGKRYSAGRIFLQVVPSFKNLQNDIQRNVNKANAGLEKQQEEIGQRNEAARSRGATKQRAKSADQELRDQERLNAAKLRQHQRFTQMLVGERVKESKRREDQERRNAKSLFDLQQRVARGQLKAEQDVARERARLARKNLDLEIRDAAKAAKARDDMERRNARNLFDLSQTIARNEQRLNEERARERRRLAQKNLGLEIRDMARAAQERARTEAKAESDAERARDRVKSRRIQQRLANMRAEDRERRRLAGGGTGSMIRKGAQGAADAIGVMKIDADSSPAQRRIAALREQLLTLSNTDIGVDMKTGDAFVQLKLLKKELLELSHNDAEVDVNVNAKLALVSLKRIEQQIDEINRKKATSGFLGMFGGMTSGADQGANSFRIFNYRVLALLVLLPTLAPMLASAAGALGAIGTAAIGGAAGLGVMIAGFTGLGDAISALGEVQDNAAKDNLAAAKSTRTAERAVRDANQGLVRAREQAARAAEDSSRRIAQAERNLADAQKDARKAQDDLAKARLDAQRQQDDLADRIKAGKLDERQALIDLFNAQVAYNAAMADGGSTNLEKEQASIDLERARLAIKGIREENADLAKEQKKGVGANESVVAAQERVVDTQQRVKDAAQDVADAQRDAQQQQVDSALAIRDAQERVADAQAGLQEALTKTGDIGSSAMQKLELAMGKLGPEGREFARFIFGLKDDWLDLRNLIQAGMLPPLQEEIEKLLDTYGPSFRDFVGTMGKTVGDFFTALGEALRSPVMKTFFETMAKYAPTFFTQWGDLFINIMKIFGGLATAFAPFAKDFMDALVDLTDTWADWAESLAGSDGFNDFIAYVKREGPKVLKLFGALFTIIMNIGKGMAETPIFDIIVGFFTFLASLDPKVIATLFTAFTGLAFASQVAAGVNALAISIGFLMTSALGPWIVGIMAVGAALVYLYNNNEGFRVAVDAAWTWIQGVFQNFMSWIQTSFLPWWTGTAMPFITGVFQAIGDFAVWLWGILGPVFRIIGELFTVMARVFVASWENILWPVLQGVGNAIVFLWEQVGEPLFGFLGKAFEGMVSGMVWVWDHILKPMFDAIADLLEGDFQGAWENAVKAIGGIWDGLKRLVADPINFVIGTVLNNGLIKAFNEVMKFLGLDTRIQPLSLVTWAGTPKGRGAGSANAAEGYATGGYTGDGGKYQPAGIVHAGEVVWSQDDVRRWGGWQTVEAMRRGFPGYAIGGMVKPVNGTYAFPWGHYPSGKRHRALDIQVPIGTPVVAPYPGTIIRDGWDPSGFGTHVRTDNDGMGEGSFTIIGHMLRELVSVGQKVAAGQLLGFTGNSGNSTGPHAHIEFRTSPYDPSSAFDFTAAFNGGRSVTGAAGRGVNLPWWADKPLEFLQGVVEKGVGLIPAGGLFGTMLRGFPGKIFGGIREFLGGIIGDGPGQDDATGGAFWNGREVEDNGTMMFDNGGMLPPGVTQVLNMTGRPERVFTEDQWARRGGAGDGGSLIGHLDVDVNGTDLSAGDVVDEIMRTMARVRHGGKYAGKAF